jgi:hypothetical protein
MSITPPSRQRSKITNGSALLPNVDGRSAWIRRTKDLIALHLADLGGPENATAAEASIVRRAAVLSVELETMEAGFATAGSATPEQLALYGTTSNSLRRLLESIGLERRTLDVTPSLSSYLAAKAVTTPAPPPVCVNALPIVPPPPPLRNHE